jgi:hypothetical protein
MARNVIINIGERTGPFLSLIAFITFPRFIARYTLIVNIGVW